MDETKLLAELDKMIATVAGVDPAGLPGRMFGSDPKTHHQRRARRRGRPDAPRRP